MRKFLLALALVGLGAAAAAAPVVTPGSLTLSGFEYAAPGATVVGYGVPVSAGVGGLQASFDDGFGPQSFTVFCIDLFSHAGAFGSSLTYDKIDYSVPDFGLAGEPAHITELSKLFTANNGVTSTSAAHSAGLQLAVWEILYDGFGGSLNTGNFKDGTLAGSAAETWANTLISLAQTSYAGYDISVFADDAYRNKPGNQNFITATQNFGDSCQLGNDCTVPEPAPLALAGTALLALALARRQRTGRVIEGNGQE